MPSIVAFQSPGRAKKSQYTYIKAGQQLSGGRVWLALICLCGLGSKNTQQTRAKNGPLQWEKNGRKGQKMGRVLGQTALERRWGLERRRGDQNWREGEEIRIGEEETRWELERRTWKDSYITFGEEMKVWRCVYII